MHRGLAVADHRDIQQRSNFGQARILHRADGEDIVAFGLRAKGIVEDELNVQRHHVRVDHHLCRGVGSVDAFWHAREGDFDARTGDQASALCQTFEISWNATAFHQTLIPDAHCKSLHPRRAGCDKLENRRCYLTQGRSCAQCCRRGSRSEARSWVGRLSSAIQYTNLETSCGSGINR